jgi:cobaltochelatase CobN
VLADYLARHCPPGRPTIGLLFYRAHWMSGNLAFVDAVIRAIEAEGANVLPVYCYSLKDEEAAATGLPRVFRRFLLDEAGRPRVDAVINTLSFALGRGAPPLPPPPYSAPAGGGMGTCTPAAGSPRGQAARGAGARAAHGGAGPDGASRPAPWVGEGPGGQHADEPVDWAAACLQRLNVPFLQAINATSPRAQWEASAGGLSPLDTAMNVALPEFDGRIITVPISFKEAAAHDPLLDAPVQRYVPAPDRIAHLAALAVRWARLRHIPNAQKRVALVLANYPSRNARLGNAVGLDTPASVINILRALQRDGYDVRDIPESGDALIHALIDRCTYDREFLTDQQVARAAGHVPAAQYASWYAAYPERPRTELAAAWGAPPGTAYCYDGALMMPGIAFGNVFVGIQPPRGFGENPIAIYHHPDLPPTHHYLAYYRWLRDVWGAHAVVHVGKHGTLEWLPGKAVGLSVACYPEVALLDLPHFYPFIVNNPGEGAQAKRRAHATIIDHLMPPPMRAESYDELTRLEQLLDEYYQVQTLDPKKLPLLQEQIWELVVGARLHEDLGTPERPADFDAFLLHIDG